MKKKFILHDFLVNDAFPAKAESKDCRNLRVKNKKKNSSYNIIFT